MLSSSSKIVMFEAVAGIVVIWTYPLGKGFFVNICETGLHTVFPHRTFPEFTLDPNIAPFLRITWGKLIDYYQLV